MPDGSGPASVTAPRHSLSAAAVPWVAAAVLMLYAAPLVHFILAGTGVAPAFNENIGYRYFDMLRAVERPSDFTHPIQGTLTGDLQ